MKRSLLPSFEKFQRPLAAALLAGDRSYSYREGLYLFSERDPSCFLAELSPLVGFSKETLPEAEQELLRVLRGETEPTLPSVAFGLSCLELLLDRVLLATLSAGDLLVNDLLAIGETPSSVHPNVLKLKICTQAFSFDTQLEYLQKLHHTLPAQVKLRLDCNGNPFDFPLEALEQVLPVSRIDYLEDPASTLAQVEKISQRLPFAIAADELLMGDNGIEACLESSAISACILKPQLIGSYSQLESIARAANSKSKRVTVTSLLETELGLVFCFLFARRLEAAVSLEPAGLLTGNIFKDFEAVFTVFGNRAQLIDAWQERLSAMHLLAAECRGSEGSSKSSEDHQPS